MNPVFERVMPPALYAAASCLLCAIAVHLETWGASPALDAPHVMRLNGLASDMLTVFSLLTSFGCFLAACNAGATAMRPKR